MAKQDPMEMIKRDLEKKYEKALKRFAEEMTYQVEAAYESVVQSFYDDYTPRYYERTYSTYLGSDKYNSPFDYTPFGNEYEYGITVSDANIPGNPYRADKDWVFNRTFDEGIHGFFKDELNEWKEKAQIAVFADFVLGGKKGEFKSFLAEHQKKSGKSIKHVPRRTSIKSIHAKTPRLAMDKAFKQLTRKKNMDMIWGTISAEMFK